MLHSLQNGWTWTFPSSEQGGFVILLALIVLSGAALAYWRRDSLSPVEVSFYWLGSALWLGLIARALFVRSQWNLLSVPYLDIAAPASGLLFALFVAAAAALVLLRYSKSWPQRGSEVGVYWLGCVLLALAAFGWLFPAYEWNWYGTNEWRNQVGSGFLAAFLVAAISAAVLVNRRRAAFSALEIGCYWAGLTLTTLFAFGEHTHTNIVLGTRDYAVLAIAITAATAIAYWWRGSRDAVRRNPGARFWWIIAALVLVLILIFWLFASPPAQA